MDIFAILLRNDVFFQKLTKLMTIGASGNPLLLLEFSNICSKLLPNRVFFQKLTKLMTIGASENPLLLFEFPKAAQRGS